MLGRYDDAVLFYESAISQMSKQVQDTDDNEQRNEWVEARKSLQTELEKVNENMNALQRLGTAVASSFDDSPPTDPDVWPPKPRKPPTNLSVARGRASTGSVASSTGACTSHAKRNITDERKKKSSIKKSTSQTNFDDNGKRQQNVRNNAADTDEQPDVEGKVFDPSGYDKELVDTIERNILLNNPNVPWTKIAGLDEAKKLLKEAAVLPFLIPQASADHGKVCACLDLLVPMDGCYEDTSKTVLVLAATNFPWDLDEALRRRLEKRIYIPLPKAPDRLHLLRIALEEVKLAEDVKLEEIAERLEGYSGADITHVCRDAAMMPLREHIANMSPEEMMSLSASEVDLPITGDHFMQSIQKTAPSVSLADIHKYEKWMEEYGAS
ncbi:hypothetical protein QR680_009206 [Steinernema hermaphroditum]|uniref:AAA ATPase AAA+ lid domain-containing protein n=1 Tax=Steinernema hermaphroditum TaxID=289476 RepID=A0AA39M8G0_9BILA|nr:hypothetical protein QR680_009206 [Steinernema hermaphroditum]